MNSFEQNRMKAMVLYILNVTGGIDFYHIFKILYFAEREHLAKWGHRMIPDDFCALDYGPVPSQLYNAIKVLDNPDTKLASQLHVSMTFAGADAPNVIIAKESADMEYISLSEKESLDKSIKENAAFQPIERQITRYCMAGSLFDKEKRKIIFSKNGRSSTRR